jgi:hypothetical protein
MGLETYQSIYSQLGDSDAKEAFRTKHGLTGTQRDLIRNSIEDMLFQNLIKDLMQVIEAICPTESQSKAVKVLISEAMRKRAGQFESLLKHWTKPEETSMDVNSPESAKELVAVIKTNLPNVTDATVFVENLKRLNSI